MSPIHRIVEIRRPTGRCSPAELLHATPGVHVLAHAAGFEEDARALVARSVAAPDVPRVLSRIAQRYGTPVPGLEEFGLSRTFPEPSDLGGRSLDAVITEAVE